MIAPNTSTRSIERRPEFADLLKEDVFFSTGSGTGVEESLNGWFDTLMLQSGIRTPPKVWLSLCLVSSVALGGLALVTTERVLLSVIAGMTGLLIPVLVAQVSRARRQSAMSLQLPPMAEELSRVARTGRNLEHAFLTVAADTPAPLGDELRISARRIEMGLDVATATRDLVDRTGVSTLAMLTAAIAVNQETGGDLIQVLERMAISVRDRLHFVARQRAATISSRLGAIMMATVPVLVVGFYSFRDPDYLNRLLSSNWGRLSFWGGLVLQLTGGLLAFRILRRSSRI